ELCARWRWKPVYSRIIDRLFDLAERGTELYYTPGNHDQFLRSPEVERLLRKSGICVNVADEFVFETQDGRRFLVLHGNRFDVIEAGYQWLSMSLSYIYEPMLFLNAWFNQMTGRRGSPYSACAWIKNRAKTAVRFFSDFEDRLFRYVRSRSCEGVICGHLHAPGVSTTSATTYINTGDWVEHCTALIERHDGQLVLESFYAAEASPKPCLAGVVLPDRIDEPGVPEVSVPAFADVVAGLAETAAAPAR